MTDSKNIITEWHTELTHILSDHPDILAKVSGLVDNEEYIAAFNYIDENLVNSNIGTTEKFKQLTEDLFFSLRF